MKKKYLFIFIIVIFVIFAVIIGSIIFLNNENIEKFNEKLSLLENTFTQNNEIKNLEKNANENIVILSICDNNTQAIVKAKEDSSLTNAYKKLKKEMSEYVRKNEYSTEFIKIDFAKDLQEISMEEFEDELSYLEQEYTFSNGVIFHYQNRENIILTEAELNSNNIIDYENGKLDLKNLNTYLTYCNKSPVTSLPTTFRTFTTISYFCDENGQVYEIDSTGKRKQENLQPSEIDIILENSSSYLSNMIETDGKFIYGYYPLKNKKIEDYNILRHAGSTWSLIVEYDSGNIEKEKIDAAINYLIDTIQCSNTGTAYVQEVKSNEIKLGGNALSVIALCEYTDKFKNSEYINLLEKLGNGILSMQREDGGYNHVLNSDDFSLKDEYRTVYYDGEATFALCKLYGITKNIKYLEAAEKSLQHFIENNYIRVQ